MMKKEFPTLALTAGEPAGIGPDLAVKLAHQQLINDTTFRLVLVADPALLKQRAAALGIEIDLPRWLHDTDAPVSVLAVKTTTPVTPGVLDANNSAYVIDTLNQAIDGCLSGNFDALVTGPVHKGIINDAGIPFTGHTELLAQKCSVENVVMMLVTETTGTPLRIGRSLRVALVTTHLPLAKVSAAITRDKLEETIRILNIDLEQRFGIDNPRILVCGLNPHAGESGYLGREEIDVISPVIEHLKKDGLKILGPVPADTAFTPTMLAQADVVLAMFHDQGLPTLKYAGFNKSVNVTLGLPIIRTSVDHGTALDLAATGDINSGSLDAAVRLACELAMN
ncbi:MAG: 4-hydroxythreonine-4-phosphate dehydrogenase PdxA [Acidiferrobacterales bacterium]